MVHDHHHLKLVIQQCVYGKNLHLHENGYDLHEHEELVPHDGGDDGRGRHESASCRHDGAYHLQNFQNGLIQAQERNLLPQFQKMAQLLLVHTLQLVILVLVLGYQLLQVQLLQHGLVLAQQQLLVQAQQQLLVQAQQQLLVQAQQQRLVQAQQLLLVQLQGVMLPDMRQRIFP